MERELAVTDCQALGETFQQQMSVRPRGCGWLGTAEPSEVRGIRAGAASLAAWERSRGDPSESAREDVRLAVAGVGQQASQALPAFPAVSPGLQQLPGERHPLQAAQAWQQVSPLPPRPSEVPLWHAAQVHAERATQALHVVSIPSLGGPQVLL